MADLTVNTGQQGRVQPNNDTALVMTSSVALSALDAVYQDATTGKLVKSDASVAGTALCDGISVYPTGANAPVTLMKEGAVYGWDVSGMGYGDPIFLSDTAGLVGDAAGTVSVQIGKVILLHGEKVAYIDISYSG